jgi:hypothetical protein
VRNKQPMREVEVCNLVRRKEGGVVSLFLCWTWIICHGYNIFLCVSTWRNDEWIL